VFFRKQILRLKECIEEFIGQESLQNERKAGLEEREIAVRKFQHRPQLILSETLNYNGPLAFSCFKMRGPDLYVPVLTSHYMGTDPIKEI
jgi:hypothetical protein